MNNKQYDVINTFGKDLDIENIMNNWIETAKQLLSRSLKPIPQELNELDWKSDISDKSERLAQHISAFANNPNGGFLVFGINDDGNIINLNKDKIDEIIKKIGNIARNNLAQPVAIEHDVIEFENKPILIIHIPENFDKPVYLRGKTVYESYKRSAGQTVKLSINEVKHLISISIHLIYFQIFRPSRFQNLLLNQQLFL